MHFSLIETIIRVIGFPLVTKKIKELIMALKDTYKHVRDLLSNITIDLGKAEGGNKAAAQRVRTGTVKLEKVAKLYRKESIDSEKTTVKKNVKKAAPKGKAPVAKKVAPKAKVTKAKPSALSVKHAAPKSHSKKGW
jgi:hypothetical protein